MLPLYFFSETMKHCLLLLGIGLLSLQLNAQTRYSLYEEFTGEQSFPCTAVNPGFQALMAANTSKAIQIAYPSPFPIAGPIYSGYKTISDARISYYSISTAPIGRLNGTKTGSGTVSPIVGNAANLTQADINSEFASSAPFNLSASHSWNSTGDSISVQITINTPAAYAPAGAVFRLRIALIEHLHYHIPPGINGEQDFPNVVREMYPNAGGTIINSVWTLGQSTTFTVKGLVPRFVNKETANIVAWIQNDADKSIQQVAVSNIVPITVDAAAAAMKPIARLQCAAGSAMISSTATLRNAGTSALTSARIYYYADGGALNLYTWSGSLAPGASTVIPLPAISVSAGNHTITDSIVAPNGGTDINLGNNIAQGPVSIFNTSKNNLPIANGFEFAAGAIPAGWILYDADSNGRNFVITKNIFGGNAGFGNSTYFLLHNNYYVPSGETNYAILPMANLPVGPKQLTFALAHAPYASENDQLDVMYSGDCGNSWTSIWNAGGSGLTASAPTTSFFIPATSDWESKLVDMTTVPVGSMIAFRAISDFGNSLYIDNVQLSSPLDVPSIPRIQQLSIRPNPAREIARIQFSLNLPGMVNFELVDMNGRAVMNPVSTYYPSGSQSMNLPLENLAAGIYSLRMWSDGEMLTRQLVVME